ncbi:MAG TPA: hypothetical protein VHE79_03915 [Spirochaetia bacterium]
MRPYIALFTVLVAVVILAAAAPARAQSVLIIDRERDGEVTLAPPLPVRDGLSDALYGEGLIVFDLPADAVPGTPAEILRLARTAGADVVVQVDTTYTVVPGTTPRRIAARGTYTATSVRTGASLASGAVDATNANREKDVDRTRLGQELGGLIAAKVGAAIAARAASPAP